MKPPNSAKLGRVRKSHFGHFGGGGKYTYLGRFPDAKWPKKSPVVISEIRAPGSSKYKVSFIVSVGCILRSSTCRLQSYSYDQWKLLTGADTGADTGASPGARMTGGSQPTVLGF
jgi:hypothetical protein